MRTLRFLTCAIFAMLLLGAFSGVAAAQDDDDTGYSLDAEALPADDDTGYEVGALPDGDAEVLGTSLARTGTNVFFLTLIGAVAIGVGVGLDRWSKGLEIVTVTDE